MSGVWGSWGNYGVCYYITECGFGEAVGLVGYRQGEIDISKRRLSLWKAKCVELY